MTNPPAPGSADPLGVHGVVPPTITAFDEDETVDYEQTAAHARYVVDGGVHGVFPLGTNGEVALLTEDERDRIVEAVVDEVGGDVPVITGVGAPSTHQTIRHAEHAEAVGADGLVVVTPYYYPLDHEATVEHYRRVAAAVDLPIYVYHIPSMTGNSISLETLDVLAGIDGVAGVKDSSKDVVWLAQAIDRHPELTFLSGSDSLLVPGLDAGCAGMVSAISDVFPEFVVELYDVYAAGEEERARELQSDVFEIRDALKFGPYMGGVKTALSAVGFDAGPLRSPLRRMDEDDEARMLDVLESYDLV